MDFTALGEQFLDQYGLLAIFGIMLLKEIGIPVPIPSDLIMLGAAARVAQGKFSLLACFLAILVPMVGGGMVQYSIAKGPGRKMIYRLGSYIGLTRARLEKAMQAVRRGGTAAVALGLTTPGVRIATVPASGLAELPVAAFLPGLVAGSAFFLGWHFAIGFIGGFLLTLLQLPLPFLVGGIIALALLGLAAWLLIRSKKRKPDLRERLTAWNDGSCPVCFAIGIVRAGQGLEAVEF